MIDRSSTDDESDEEFEPRRNKLGKKKPLTTYDSDAKELPLPSSDVLSVAHRPPGGRVPDTESKLPRSRFVSKKINYSIITRRKLQLLFVIKIRFN